MDVTHPSQAHSAYRQIAAPTRTLRGIEHEVMARITHRLKAASAKGTSDFPELVAALHENRQLWSTFAIAVADPMNPLPQELRARIFFLAEFTLTHTGKVLSEAADAAPLIDINTSVMRGLREQGPSA